MFGRRQDVSGASGAEPANRFVWLNDLVAAVGRSMFDTTRLIAGQHIEAFGELYDEVSAPDGAADGRNRLRPKTIVMEIPAFVTHSEGAPARPVDVPLPALAQHNALVVDEATFEVDCTVDCFEETRGGNLPAAIGLRLDRVGGTPARLMLRMRRVDTTEGVSRVNDSLLRSLP